MEQYPIVSNLDNCWLQVNATAPKKVVIFVDSPQYYERYKDYDLKVAVICEPDELIGSTAVFKEWAEKFDIILTWDEELLKLPNAKRFLQPYSAHWIDILNYNKWDKEFSVSTVVGGKNETVGHKMRHQLYYRQSEITVPKRFYISSAISIQNTYNSPYLGKSKEPMFDSMFHICIENVGRRENAITEKLIDSLVTGTVPIHWGCTNLDEFFDTRGIIVAKDVDDIVQICNQLTPELYHDMKPYIENNKKNALKYFDIRVNVIKEVRLLLKEKYGIC
jgi:hypothetical protein